MLSGRSRLTSRRPQVWKDLAASLTSRTLSKGYSFLSVEPIQVLLKSAGANRVEGRILVYASVCAVLLLVSLLVHRSTWRRSRELHTLLGTIATPLALFTSSIDVMCHYTRKSRTFLLLGSGYHDRTCNNVGGELDVRITFENISSRDSQAGAILGCRISMIVINGS